MIIHDISNEEYHARPELSSTQLKDFYKSPARYLHSLSGHRVERKAFKTGNLFHTAFLEPRELGERYIVETFDSRTKEGKARKAEIDASGKIHVSEQEMATAIAAANAAREVMKMHVHKPENAMIETAIIWHDEESGVDCRLKADFMLPPCEQFKNGLIMDYKSTVDSSPEEFGRQSFNLCYHLSAAHYSKGYMSHFGTTKPPEFAFLAIEKEAPYLPAWYEVDDMTMEYSLKKWREIVNEYVQCRISNEWPNHRESTSYLVVPRWLENEVYGETLGELEIKYDA